MASLKIGESSSNTQEGCSSSSCVIQVGYELMINDGGGADFSSARIFRVPKPLRYSNDHFYSPHLVSIGPFHYGKPELSGMEQHKSEAVRRMQKRMQSRYPQFTIKSFVEGDIVDMNKSIRDFYGEIVSYDTKELAWMVTRDACFIFEFIINYIKYFSDFKTLYEETRVSSSKYDPVYDICFQNPTRDRLMDDILLFENQIPLFILQHLLQIQMGSADEASKKLHEILRSLLFCTTRQKVFTCHVSPDKNPCHLLEAVYDGMLGILSSYECKPIDEKRERDFEKLPSAVELTNAGVKLRPVRREFYSRTQLPAIQGIRFDVVRLSEISSTFYLPEVCVSAESESLMRSMIAMEVSSEERYYPRPMTQFARLMDELVDSEEDIAVLRKAGIIKSHMGSDQEVAQVFNSFNRQIIYMPNCKPIDDVRMSFQYWYRKKKCTSAWMEFRRFILKHKVKVLGFYFTLIATFLTFVQVVCLFSKCGPKSS